MCKNPDEYEIKLTTTTTTSILHHVCRLIQCSEFKHKNFQILNKIQ